MQYAVWRSLWLWWEPWRKRGWCGSCADATDAGALATLLASGALPPVLRGSSRYPRSGKFIINEVSICENHKALAQ